MLQLAVEADWEAVNHLARQIHAMHVSWRPDIFEMPDILYSPERFRSSIESKALYVAKIGDRVAGYVLVSIRPYDKPGAVKRRVMILDEICVDEACRNQGIGTQIMTEVRALARAFGCTDLQLGVYPQNDAAVAFYQKCGFTIRSIDMQRKV